MTHDLGSLPVPLESSTLKAAEDAAMRKVRPNA